MVSDPVEGSLFVDDFAIYFTGYHAELILQTSPRKMELING